MRILFVSQYFPPEMGAPAARVSELARHWVESGHDVTVLTGFPNHPTGVVPPAYRGRLWRLVMRENHAGARVERTWLWPLPNRRTWERIANYTSFAFSAMLRGLFLPRPDVVIGTSPQLLVGVAGLWLAWAKRVPFVFEVRDLWPESLAAVGVSGERSAMNRVLGRIAGMLYQRSDHIVVVTPSFKEHLIAKWRVSPEKISVVENGVETERFAPAPANEDVRREFGVEGRFVVSWIGTLGNAHGLETLLDAAERLRARPEIAFLLIGEGAEKDAIARSVRARRLENVRIFDQQPRERVPELICASDVCLVLLRRSEVFRTVIPTKMLEFMSCGRPVILGVEGQALEIAARAQAAISIPPEDAGALAAAIERLHSDADLRRQLGDNGHRFIVEDFSRQSTAHRYLEVLAPVTNAPKP